VKLERTQPGFLAGERLRKVLFGEHPYAKNLPSEAQVAAYEREDLQTVYREAYTPENGMLLLVGDFEPKAILATVDKIFWPWSGKKPAVPSAHAPANPRGRRVTSCTFLEQYKRKFFVAAIPSRASIRTGSSLGSRTACTVARSTRGS